MTVVFDPLHLQAATLDVVAASHGTPALLMQRQQQRLTRLLDAARQGSAFYRERLGSARVASFARLPPVRRAELMGQFDQWVSDPALRLDELRDFTRDTARVAQPWLGRYMVWESSGTSGQPGIFVQDAQAMAVYDALEAVRHRVPGRSGARGLLGAFSGAFAALEAMGGADRTALVTVTGGHFASIVSFERLRQLNPWLAGNARAFDLMQPTDALVRQLNDFQPSVLATYPTMAALLADEAQAQRLHIRPRCVVLGGETVSAGLRARIGQALGAAVRSSYGASECLPMAWECAHGHLHVNEDWVILEPVDERGRPVPVGQPSHSVLLTNLANLVQPLIRYDLGDGVRVHRQRCACGSALPVIEVRGRCDDVLHVPAASAAGGRASVSLLPLALCTVVEEEGGVFDFQLQQRDARTLVLRLPQQGEQAQAAIERCRQALQRFAQAQGAAPIRVLGEPGCPTPRGRSGKACRVALKDESPRREKP
ncbi:MAG: phenylacetate--CoA ligase family protein [Pseudomonadota bacterium]|nr:phenylacetate--CoA ligase family protein [Pseudomonadota bacterium]